MSFVLEGVGVGMGTCCLLFPVVGQAWEMHPIPVVICIDCLHRFPCSQPPNAHLCLKLHHLILTKNDKSI